MFRELGVTDDPTEKAKTTRLANKLKPFIPENYVMQFDMATLLFNVIFEGGGSRIGVPRISKEALDSLIGKLAGPFEADNVTDARAKELGFEKFVIRKVKGDHDEPK